MNGEKVMTFMKLPHDLILNCLARVSRMHYQTLSLVSKRFRSLLASRELYQTRTFLGCTETSLYVCLNKRWLILCLKPNSSKRVLVPIKSPNSPNTYYSDIANVGSNIYSICGSISRYKRDVASSRVMVLDCYSHTWREAPSMLVARKFPSACVLDGKIYVTGGSKNLDASNWMEVFDTKTQTWEFKLSGNSEKVCNGYMCQSIAYNGTVYVKRFKTDVVHKLHEGSWIRAENLTPMSWVLHWSSSACVIGNVLYTTFGGIINWYDSKVKKWKTLKVLGRLFGSRLYTNVKLADYGGKLAISWEEIVFVNGFFYERKIWCGEIAIVKRQGEEVWGNLEWFDIVYTTNEPFGVAHVLAVTL